MQPHCPICGDILEIRSIIPDWFPYTHVDVTMMCPMEGRKYVFGIPKNKIAGLSMIIYDTNPREALEGFMALGERKCPWGHGKMMNTKIFGDWFPDEKVVEYQWKCATCFVTTHESHDRKFDHGARPPISDEEMKIIKERLERMGYLG
jgi:hypothetical protein